MKYYRLFHESIQRTALKKVRIKIDPAAVGVSEDLANCDGYEGYVLSEDTPIAKVIVVAPGGEQSQVRQIPIEYLELIQQEITRNKFDELKSFIIASLDAVACDPIIQQIQSCSNMSDVESFLRDYGLTDEEIVKLYKYYSML